MTQPIIDAVAVASRDLARTISFYERLGFAFAPCPADARHVEAIVTPGAVRLMIDDAGLMSEILGEAPRPGTTSAFALRYDGPAAVDAAATAAAQAGGGLVRPPFDAPWGQRYAIVADPDGYRVDLFAPLT